MISPTEVEPRTKKYHHGPFGPLRHAAFRSIWLASVGSNIGTMMQTTGATWVMGTLSPSPLMVSLVQASGFLPTFLLAIPAGALADLIDRRKLLIVTQLWMLVAAAWIGYLSWTGHITSWSLLSLTFLMGAGAALNAPAWQAIIWELVPIQDLEPAIALGSASFNIARAIGPAIGGLVLATLGPAYNFILNAISFMAVIWALYRWKKPSRLAPTATPESLIEAMISGLRYTKSSAQLHSILDRTLGFVIPGSAIWALLPVLTRDELNSGPEIYGILLGCIGIGAVIGMILLPYFRARLSLNQHLETMTVVFGFATLLCGWAHHSIALTGFFLVCAGIAWLCNLAVLNTLVQSSVPEWVRARAVSIYLLCLFGGLTVGSAAWGALATWIGCPLTLTLAGLSFILGFILRLLFNL